MRLFRHSVRKMRFYTFCKFLKSLLRPLYRNSIFRHSIRKMRFFTFYNFLKSLLRPCIEKYRSIHVQKMIPPRFARATNLKLVLESTLSHLYRNILVQYTCESVDSRTSVKFVARAKRNILLTALNLLNYMSTIIFENYRFEI